MFQHLDEIVRLSADTTTPGEPMLRDFGSWSEYRAEIEALPHTSRPSRHNYERGWTGADNWQHAISMARDGDAYMADKASSLIDNMNEQGFLSEGPVMLSAAEVGFMPLVPAVLSGDPMAMLSRRSSASMLAPVKIVCGIGAGGSVSAEQLARRGAAIAALAIALNATRPVELYGCGIVQCTGGAGNGRAALQLWRLETRPADLPTIAWALSSAAVHRVFGFTMADRMGGAQRFGGGRNVPFTVGGSTMSMERQTQIMRLALDLDEHDLFIPRAIQDDDPLLDKPEQWVKDKLAAYAVA